MSSSLPPKAKPDAIRAIFTAFRSLSESPRTELLYNNGYQLLVAVVLSAQATDKGVNKATAPLFAHVHTPAEMVQLGEEGLTGYIKSIGLYRTKAKNVIALSQYLVERHGGEVPDTMDELTALPGVGRKTANVVLSQLFGHHTIAVDTHVYRVARRLGLSRGSTPDAVEADLMKVIPAEFLQHAHHWLILHGRYTCLARAPKCAECPVAQWCHSMDKTTR
ncbi:MAG: endonuclease III [Blastochloris viridis]|uniref:Endonuclease III n=1 Tax=Blastochloris viridis TaxID=1079 RepID=A0A6N4RDA6_BLAVI|nr:MAG: endonuclease III [Blastochloris viridis]